MKTIRIRALTLILTVLIGCLFSACGGIFDEYIFGADIFTAAPTKTDGSFNTPATSLIPGESLDIYFIDVGQGDSALLVSPSGRTMLIDAGERNNETKIALLMESLGIDSLDIVVASHPHSDHIGAMAAIIEEYPITDFYMPEFDYDSKTYENMLDALDENGIEPIYLSGGEDSFLDWDLAVTVACLSPLEDMEYDDANDVSIMLRISYGDDSVLFTGDCEAYAENGALYMLPFTDFSADVLKVGHHGSSTSSSEKFLSAVNPQYAVISCGYDNSYGHPHDETLFALEQINAVILRTDELGTIHMRLTGSKVLVVDD